MKLTADVVAAAIVAACRETGEDPLAFASEAHRDFNIQWRHYAHHALVHHFGIEHRVVIARLLCCPGKATYFHRSSLWGTLGQGPQRKTPVAWWLNESLEHVIQAVGRVLGEPETEPVKSAKLSDKLNAPVVKPKPVVVKDVPGNPRGMVRSRFDSNFGKPQVFDVGGDDQIARRERERRECRDLLAEAAANTEKLQALLPKEDD